jgi:hypothetical protein
VCQSDVRSAIPCERLALAGPPVGAGNEAVLPASPRPGLTDKTSLLVITGGLFANNGLVFINNGLVLINIRPVFISKWLLLMSRAFMLTNKTLLMTSKSLLMINKTPLLMSKWTIFVTFYLKNAGFYPKTLVLPDLPEKLPKSTIKNGPPRLCETARLLL